MWCRLRATHLHIEKPTCRFHSYSGRQFIYWTSRCMIQCVPASEPAHHPLCGKWTVSLEGYDIPDGPPIRRRTMISIFIHQRPIASSATTCSNNLIFRPCLIVRLSSFLKPVVYLTVYFGWGAVRRRASWRNGLKGKQGHDIICYNPVYRRRFIET